MHSSINQRYCVRCIVNLIAICDPPLIQGTGNNFFEESLVLHCSVILMVLNMNTKFIVVAHFIKWKTIDQFVIIYSTKEFPTSEEAIFRDVCWCFLSTCAYLLYILLLKSASLLYSQLFHVLSLSLFFFFTFFCY